jgi:hypothetical protein
MKSLSKKLKLVYWISLIVLLNSCAIKKALKGTDLRKLESNQVGYIEKKLDENNFTRDSVYIKKLIGSVYTDEKRVPFKGRIYSVKDKELLIILYAKIGVEAFRIWMDEYDITIIDHVNKKRYESDYPCLEKRIGYEINIDLVQNILLANNFNILKPSNAQLREKVVTKSNHYSYKIQSEDLSLTKYVHPGFQKLMGFDIHRDEQALLNCKYEFKENSELPQSVYLIFNEVIKGIQDIDFKYQKIGFSFKPKKMKPKVKRYEVVKL